MVPGTQQAHDRGPLCEGNELVAGQPAVGPQGTVLGKYSQGSGQVRVGGKNDHFGEKASRAHGGVSLTVCLSLNLPLVSLSLPFKSSRSSTGCSSF